MSTTPLSNTFEIEQGADRRARIPIYLESTKRRPETIAGWTGRVSVTRSLETADLAVPLLERAVDDMELSSKDAIVDFTSAESEALGPGDFKWTVRVVTDTGKRYAIIPGGTDFKVTPRGSSVP